MCSVNCQTQNCKARKKTSGKRKNNLLWWTAAILSLFAAWMYGYFSSKANDVELLIQKFEDTQIEVLSQNDRLFKLRSKEKEFYVALGSAWGYGGNMEVAILTDSTANVEEIVLVDNRETYAYIQRLKDRKYFMQYKGKHLGEAFSAGHDIDVISGATISSEAISRAVQSGGHTLAKNYFKLQPTKINGKFKISQSVIGLIVFFLFSIFLFGRWKWLNISLLILSIAGIGIAWNNSFSISSLAKLFVGGFPNPGEDLSIYVILFFLIGGILIFSKNIYCYRICPFYGVQYILSKLSGMHLEMHPVIVKYGSFIKRFLLWFALLIMFLNTSPTISNFEPFAMIFSLEGVGIQWYILPAVIVGALFSPSFFCRYFCPAGESLNILTKLRKGKAIKGKSSAQKIELKDLVSKKYLLQTVLYFVVLFVIVLFMVISL